MPSEMTQAAYARHRGVSQEAIRQAMNAGRIPFFKRGRRLVIDAAVADEAWSRNTDPDQAQRGSGNKAPAKIETSWSAAKTRESVARARMLELELLERQGELVSVTAMRAHWSTTLVMAAEQFRGIPDRVASSLAAELGGVDDHIVHRVLTGEIARVMELLSPPPGPRPDASRRASQAAPQ